jgi:serine protease
MVPPEAAYGRLPPRGAASGPAKPAPRRPLGCAMQVARSALFVALAASAGAAAWAQGANGLIVQLRDAPSHEQRGREQALALRDDARWHQVLDAAGVRVAGSRPSGAGARLLQFERRLSREQARVLVDRLQRRPEVAWVVPNERERRLQTPNDPLFADQWWLRPVGGSDGNVISQRLRGVPGFQRGWQQNTGAAGARVAVLDTGITSHPELAGRVLGGHDFVSDVAVANDGNGRDNDPSDPGDWVSAADAATPDFDGCTVEDSSWHGTLIAGIVAARTNEGSGVASANWDGRIVPVRVAGKCGADVADIVDGMRWAAGLPVAGVPPNPNPARIINLSFGGSAACNNAYQNAINDIRAAGAVLVVAAGNERTSPTRPANCVGAIGVAAVNRDGFKTNYSNFGPTLKIATVGGDDGEGLWGDLFADGGLLTIYNTGTTVPGASSHAYLFGTSFATPVVAGALSLMLSVNPGLSADQLHVGLAQTARPHVTSPHIGVCSSANPWRCACTTATCGAGLLDVEQALLYAAAPTTYVAPAWTSAVLNNTETAAAAARGADSGSSPPPPPPGNGGGSGGGHMQPGWLLALAIASALLWRGRRH